MTDILAVIDYGMGNLRSVAKALEHVSNQHKIVITNDEAVIRKAERIVFPGQGAIGAAMNELKSLQLVDLLKELVRAKPFLGICLGLQALVSHSDEDGGVDGLDIIQGGTHHFESLFKKVNETEHLKIPHMGWNQVKQVQPHALWNNIEDESRFYFVHSYYVEPTDSNVVTGTTQYGGDFCSAAGIDNLFAVQFHPEKSQTAGLQLLKNFVNWEV